MKIRKLFLCVFAVVILVGCQNANAKKFNENEFYNDVRKGLSTVVTSECDSSIKTNLEFSERLQKAIRVLNIQLIYNSETVNKSEYQDIIRNLRNKMDLETLRTNYDLIHITFTISNGNIEKNNILYEYLNMTNTFAEGDSSLTSLIIK